MKHRKAEVGKTQSRRVEETKGYGNILDRFNFYIINIPVSRGQGRGRGRREGGERWREEKRER